MADSADRADVEKSNMITWVPSRPATGSHDDMRNEGNRPNNPASQSKWRRWSSGRWRGQVGLLLMQTATLLMFIVAFLLKAEPRPAIFPVSVPLSLLLALGCLLFLSGVGFFKRTTFFEYTWPTPMWKPVAIGMATPWMAAASALAPPLAGVFILLIFQVIAAWIYGKAALQLRKVTRPALSPGSTNK